MAPSTGPGPSAVLNPAVQRILFHSLLFSIAGSIAEVLLGFYIVSIGLSTTDVGLMSTVMRIAGMVTALPLGLVIDRFGAQRSIVIGAAAYGLSWAILLLAASRPALFAAQFLVGTAVLLATTALQPLLAEHTDNHQRGTLFGINMFLVVGAGTIGGVLGGALPSWAALLSGVEPQSAEAYRIALIGLIVVTAAAVLPLWGRLPRAHSSHIAAAAASAAMRPIAQRRLVRFAVPAMLVGSAAGTIMPFQALFLRDVFAQSDAAVGVILGLSSLGAGLGALLGAPLTTRVGERMSSTYLRALGTPSMLLMLVPNLYIAAAGMTLRGAFISASWAQGDSLIMGMTPLQQRGRLMAMSSLLWSAGWAVTSALSGWSQPRFGYGPQFALAAVMYALAAWSGYTLKDHHGRPA